MLKLAIKTLFLKASLHSSPSAFWHPSTTAWCCINLANLCPVFGSEGGVHYPSWSWFQGAVCILQRRRFWFSQSGQQGSHVEMKWSYSVFLGLFLFFSKLHIYVFSGFLLLLSLACLVFRSFLWVWFCRGPQVYIWVGEKRYLSLLSCLLPHCLIFPHMKGSIPIWCFYRAFIECFPSCASLRTSLVVLYKYTYCIAALESISITSFW